MLPVVAPSEPRPTLPSPVSHGNGQKATAASDAGRFNEIGIEIIELSRIWSVNRLKTRSDTGKVTRCNNLKGRFHPPQNVYC